MAGCSSFSSLSSALKKLEDQLTCPVCLSDYKDPRVLQCIHTFCLKCLNDLAKRESPSEASEETFSAVECPVCRKKTRARSIEDLQKAFHVHSLFEIKRDLEKSELKPILCEVHRMELKFYCKDCSELLCNGCILGAHKLHSFSEISLAAQEGAKDTEKKLSEIDLNISHIEDAVEAIETGFERAASEEREIQESIRESCDKARKLIEEREQSLVEELHQIMHQKLQNLRVQKEKLQVVENQLCICREAVQESLQEKLPVESLVLQRTLLPMVNDAFQAFQDVTHTARPAAFSDVAFFVDESIFEQLSEYGKVYVKVPHAEHCLVKGEGLSKAKVGSITEVQLSLYNQHKLEIDADLASHMVSSELYSSGTESSYIRCSVEKQDKNLCTVRYAPVVKGMHKLSIDVLGNSVPGSPFSVSVRAPFAMIGPRPLHMVENLSLPWGVVLDKSGRLCVAVSGKKEVVMVDGHSGKLISTAVKRGLLVSSLEEPSAVAFDGDGNLIVADLRLCQVHRVSPDGRILQSVGYSGRKPLEFSYIAAVAVHPITGRIYVAEWEENNRIQILNKDFSFYKKFGCSGIGPGQFQCPSGIAFDSEGNVFVADCNNGRIQVFTCDGEYIREFGKQGRKEERLGLPMGLCMDHTADVLYVTDVLKHRVSVFTTKGEFGRSFGSCGAGPGEFNKPQGIAVDEFRFVYVSDTLNNRIQVF